jgi:hypothetical protein
MKTLTKIIIVWTFVLFSDKLSAQPGHGLVKQPPKINGAIRAATNAGITAANAKIHANSNSVYGTGSTYKRTQPKQEEVKKDEIKDDAEVKKSKGKKQKK